MGILSFVPTSLHGQRTSLHAAPCSCRLMWQMADSAFINILLQHEMAACCPGAMWCRIVGIYAYILHGCPNLAGECSRLSWHFALNISLCRGVPSHVTTLSVQIWILHSIHYVSLPLICACLSVIILYFRDGFWHISCHHLANGLAEATKWPSSELWLLQHTVSLSWPFYSPIGGMIFISVIPRHDLVWCTR